VLQLPLSHLTGAGVTHWPLELHVAAAVFMPLEQDCAAPHVVPGALFVLLSTHIAAPAVHDSVPW